MTDTTRRADGTDVRIAWRGVEGVDAGGEAVVFLLVTGVGYIVSRPAKLRQVMGESDSCR